ncbi:hypothetical protein JL720_12710 [Aureococcus anophagefferens]|nr:hypothetical protein JL720_12710 [Aureococcus anophagefferens]
MAPEAPDFARGDFMSQTKSEIKGVSAMPRRVARLAQTVEADTRAGRTWLWQRGMELSEIKALRPIWDHGAPGRAAAVEDTAQPRSRRTDIELDDLDDEAIVASN